MATRRKSLPISLTYDYKVPLTKPAWWRKMGFSIHLSDILTDDGIERRRLIAALSHASTTETGDIIFVSHDGLCNRLVYNQIHLTKLLGKGSYSSVYAASYICQNSFGKIKYKNPCCALKYITSKTIVSRDILIEFIVHTYVSKILDSSEVPRLIRVGYCIDTKLPFVLMEPLTGGMSLGDLLQSSKYTINQKSTFVIEVFSKLQVLLNKLHKTIKFVHSDLHPDNVYVRLVHGHVNSVAILDFGLSSMQIGAERIGSKCAFVPEFNDRIDLEFLAFAILMLSKEYINSTTYKFLYIQCRGMIDNSNLIDTPTWGDALIALNTLPWCFLI